MARELAASMQKGGGLITVEDLAQYEVKEREAMRGSYRGYDIISAPPPSSGGTALIEILNILEGYDLAKFRGRTTPAVHLTLEAFRRAFFDRAEFMGDPDFSKIPVAQLIDKRYGAAWRESIDPGARQRQQGIGPSRDLQLSSNNTRPRTFPAQWRRPTIRRITRWSIRKGMRSRSPQP